MLWLVELLMTLFASFFIMFPLYVMLWMNYKEYMTDRDKRSGIVVTEDK